MYEDNNGTCTITCDKCGKSNTALTFNAGDAFFTQGWVANFRAKKYVHICYDCQPKKMKKTTDFVRERFPVAR